MDTCSAIGHTAALYYEMSTVWGTKTRTTLRETFGLNGKGAGHED